MARSHDEIVVFEVFEPKTAGFWEREDTGRWGRGRGRTGNWKGENQIGVGGDNGDGRWKVLVTVAGLSSFIQYLAREQDH